jgi:MFS superfamily sulfate permease-like transporter
LEPAGFFRLLWQFFSKLDETHAPTLAVGAITLAVLLALGKWARKVPGPLVAVALGIVASAVAGFGDLGVKLLGAIPAGLPLPKIPDIAVGDWEPLAVGAVGLALISYNSAMVTARGFAAKNRYDIDSNQEFVALGVADIGAGVLQGFAISGADSRTAVNDSVGGKSQVTGLIAAGVLVLTLIYFTGPLRWLPMAVLSAVLIKAAMGLFDLPSLITLRRVSPQEFRISLATLLGVITVGVLPGVIVAVTLAIIQLLVRASRPNDAILGRIPGTNIFRDLANEPTAQSLPGLVIYRFDASLVFFNADYFRGRVNARVREAAATVRFLVLDAETMPSIDTTGAHSLDLVCNNLESQGIKLVVAAAKGSVRTMLERTGLLNRIGQEHVFPTLQMAVETLALPSRSGRTS